MNSSASANRRAGSFSSARSTTPSSAGGIVRVELARRHRRLGHLLERDGRPATRRRTARARSASRTARCRSSTGPTARRPGLPCACSGDRYCAVPMTEPVSVMSDAPARAIPKSVTLTRPVVVDQHVVRLDVAVHDAALVREARRAQDLQHDVDRRLGRRRAALADDVLERPALDVLHRDVVGAVPLAAVEDARRCSGAGGPPRSTPRGGSARRTARPRRSRR